MRLLVLLFGVLFALAAAERKLREQRPDNEGGLLERAQPEEESGEEFVRREFSSEEEESEPRGGGWLGGDGFPDAGDVGRHWGSLWKRLLGRFGGEDASGDASGEDVDSSASSGSSTWLDRFTQRFRPWWQGENVCKREEVSEEEEESGEDSHRFFGSLFSTSCQDLGTVYKCRVRIAKEGAIQVRTVVRECCHGYTRDPDSNGGCTQELELKSLLETLREHNLTSLIDTLEATGLDETLADGNFTLFAPTNEALSTLSPSSELEVVTLDSEDRQDFARGILEGHVVADWAPRHSWSDEGLLDSLADNSIRINAFTTFPHSLLTANCAPIQGKQIRSSNGLINIVERVMMPARQTLWDLISGDARFSVFASLVDEELQEKLMEEESALSVLAFTDEAFRAIPKSLQEKILAKEGCMQGLIWDLVLPHTICSSAIRKAALVRTFGGHQLNATRDEESETLSFQDVKVEIPDRMAKNGLIHVLDGVPMLDHMKDVVATAKNSGGALFARSLARHGLIEEIQSKKAVTLFVPPDASLEELDEDTDVEELLKNHIVDNLQYSQAVTLFVPPDASLEELDEDTDVEELLKNHIADNLVLDSFRSLSNTVVPPDASLEELDEDTDVEELLKNHIVDNLVLDSFRSLSNTVVPPDASLEELDEDTDVEELLKNHIVDNLVDISAENRETLIETEAGQTLLMTVHPLPLIGFHGVRANIGCARILKGNSQACGGLVHFIDRPLAVAKNSILQELQSRSELSEFLTLLEIAGLDERLGQGNFVGSVLAVPNDELAETIDEGAKRSLVEDPDKLRSLLTRHILKEAACCNSLSMGSLFRPRRLETLDEGLSLGASSRGGVRRIGGVRISQCDIAATNGLVHVLSAPIPKPRRRSLFDLLGNVLLVTAHLLRPVSSSSDQQPPRNVQNHCCS